VEGGAHRIGGDHDPMPGQPVGPHTAEQEQSDHRRRLGAQHETEVGGRSRPLRHEQRDGYKDHAVADHAGRLAEEQVPEVPVAENA
jgi:hypothetical protein